MKKQEKQQYEVYNHRIIWGAAVRNLDLSDQQSEGSKFHALAAMFLFYTAFEGYLNWLGVRIAPEVWADERQFFSRAPYQGTLGKYRFLSKILNQPETDSSKGVFQTAKELNKLRDMVAHPKVEKGERPVKYKEGYFPPLYESELDKKVSLQAAKRAKEHLSILADSLHSNAKELYSSSVHEASPFSSMLGFEITDA
jgi:hypothetical protein